MTTLTLPLHDQADLAALRGDFNSALRFALEALRIVPADGRARLKVALCLAALGKPEASLKTLKVVAQVQLRRGYVLSAIGACRDGLAIHPNAPEMLEMLDRIHQRIYRVEGQGRTRVPPPAPPIPSSRADASSLLELKDPVALLAKATEIGTQDPEVGLETPHDVASVPLFSDLSKEAFISLVPRMIYHKLSGSHVVVREGEAGHSLFIVVQGEVSVARREQAVARLGAGALFGEMALIRSKDRTATVTTTQNSELFEIDRATVEKVAAEYESVREDLVQFARRRLIMNLMATSKIFRPFDDAQRLEILRSFASRVVEKGTTLISEGTEPSGLYLILEGEVEVTKREPSGDKLVLAYLREGEVVGEIGLINKEKTTATVTTTEKSVLFYLDRAAFEAFVRAHPKVFEYLQNLSGARLEEINDAVAAEGVVVSLDEIVML